MKQETPVRKSAHAEKITSSYAHAAEVSYTLTSKGWVDWVGRNLCKLARIHTAWNVELEEFQEQDSLLGIRGIVLLLHCLCLQS